MVALRPTVAAVQAVARAAVAAAAIAVVRAAVAATAVAAVQAAATQAPAAHPAEAIQLPAAHAQVEADTLAEVDTQEEAAPVLHVQADLPPEGNRINASF